MISLPPVAPTMKDEKVKKAEKTGKTANQKSLKRPADDEVIEVVKPASENLGLLKEVNANDSKAVEATTDSKAKEVKKIEFSGPLGSRVLGEGGDMLGTGQRIIEGVKITDVRVGTGLMATKGAKLYVHYSGRVDGGVVFDDNMDGMPYVFVLGEGEVIRGWEIGLLGMRVGGERRLDIPPALCSGEEEDIPGAPADAHWIYHSKFLFSLISSKMLTLTTFLHFSNSQTHLHQIRWADGVGGGVACKKNERVIHSWLVGICSVDTSVGQRKNKIGMKIRVHHGSLCRFLSLQIRYSPETELEGETNLSGPRYLFLLPFLFLLSHFPDTLFDSHIHSVTKKHSLLLPK